MTILRRIDKVITNIGFFLLDNIITKILMILIVLYIIVKCVPHL